ncbi:hypothetical protein EOT10_17845 [Streptomyces antnestii]|uniref:Tn3 transposase DDE domain-containing protein n=1 Tax=Streptomyces antnestii TaxID=2494256 RepID=A0A3S2VHS2_9ACTN|nr:hypothetical protein EOT10_17845 [Streptomyces sp. San01]
MQAYRTGEEDQLGALGPVLNAAALWTTRYLDAVVTTLRALPADQREHDVLAEDVSRLSHADLIVVGRYGFRGSTPAGGAPGASRNGQASLGVRIGRCVAQPPGGGQRGAPAGGDRPSGSGPGSGRRGW